MLTVHQAACNAMFNVFGVNLHLRTPDRGTDRQFPNEVIEGAAEKAVPEVYRRWKTDTPSAQLYCDLMAAISANLPLC